MAVFLIPVDEIRRTQPHLRKLGDSVVVSGLWAPSDDAERVSTLFVVERVEGGYFVAPLGVEPPA